MNELQFYILHASNIKFICEPKLVNVNLCSPNIPN